MSRIGNLFGRFRAKPRTDREQETACGPSWLIAGLGNPGGKYALSRHNVGFMTLEVLAERHRADLNRRKFNAACGEIRVNNEVALLAKPQTFYNNSGESIAAIMSYFRIPLNSLIVVHDDLDLEPGRIRIKRGGGDAGNRGIRSIAGAMGSAEFVRIRIGIGRPPADIESKDFVLLPMSDNEIERLQPVIERAADAAESLIVNGLERSMERFNQRV
jgi:PTH1 family peptidyl-tRNA hydrolase